MAKKRGLGKGIHSLIGEQGFEDVEVKEEGLQEVELSKIKTNPKQMRKDFNEENIKSLAESIKSEGLIQPVVLRSVDDGYELIAGEQRTRAFKFLNRKKIPAIVMSVPDEKLGILALIENLSRKDLNPIEVAQGYKDALAMKDMTQLKLSKSLGVSRSSIANVIRLLELPEKVKDYIKGAKLSEGHGKVLCSVEDDVLRGTLADECAAGGWSVRYLEQRIKELKNDGEGPEASDVTSMDGSEEVSKKSAEEVAKKDPNVKKIENDLEQILGTKVQVFDKNGQGRIVISYYSSDDFTRILDIVDNS